MLRRVPSGVKLLHTVEAAAAGIGAVVQLDADDPLHPLEPAPPGRYQPDRRAVLV